MESLSHIAAAEDEETGDEGRQGYGGDDDERARQAYLPASLLSVSTYLGTSLQN
jgi:hypothetical protein